MVSLISLVLDILGILITWLYSLCSKRLILCQAIGLIFILAIYATTRPLMHTHHVIMITIYICAIAAGFIWETIHIAKDK